VTRATLFVLSILLFDCDLTAAPPVLRDWRIVELVGEYGRNPLQRDPIEAQLTAPDWKHPQVGQAADPARKDSPLWRAATPSAAGELEAAKIRGGYAAATVEVAEPTIMLLEASGHAAASINGQWRAGDPYALGWLRLPVELQAGQNELLFHVAAPKFRAQFTPPPAPQFFVTEDLTAPNLVSGEEQSLWAAIPVTNATTETLAKPILMAKAGAGDVSFTPLASIGPLTTYKAPFRLPVVAAEPGQELKFHLELRTSLDGPALAAHDITLRCVAPGELQVRTFVSRIDGGVQRYAILPAKTESTATKAGILLALHGAGQSCEELLAKRNALSWAHIVAPDNRRPHGFDWEDWGAVDAEEALADARQHVPHDATRNFVVGHEMGGHGALLLASRRPDRFAAAGTSAAWLSYWTYGGMPTVDPADPIAQELLRAASPSNLLTGLTNLGSVGLYVRHGAMNPRVPPTHGQQLRSQLGAFHPDFAYHEHAGDDAAANVLGDWPALADFVRTRQLAPSSSVDSVDFKTANPGVAANCDWARLESQREPFAWSRMVLKRDRLLRTITGTTENVRRLSLDIREFTAGPPRSITLDGQTITRLRRVRASRLWLAQGADQRWRNVNPPRPLYKNPQRSGAFKSVFDNNAVLIYGTKGNAEENAWAAAKARFDAETFWYRGNGSLETMPDTEFDPAQYRNRNVILYGNADTNAAWSRLLSTSAVQVQRGEARVDVRHEAGDSLATLFIQPKIESARALVGVVGGTGLRGMQATNRLRYFVAGIAYPDLLLFDAAALSTGPSEVRVLGFFADDWRAQDAPLLWRDLAL
jgi:pimeloyl-ACP methyl ester carboxylesterase